jgi:Fe-Mn family superoxide dismutase
MQINRRTALTAALTAAAATSLPAAALPAAAQTAPAPATGFTPSPQPLPFDPAGVPGLSAKLLTSHHDNNYVSAVKRIGAIKGELAKLDMATVPGFMLNGLKREELIAWNSMLLHEVYFSCLGTGGKPGAALGGAIERDFGSMARWAAEFSAMGKALGGGSGWVLLQWSPHDGRLTNQWASDHTQTLAGGTPILAMDMYEHAYAMDYGAKAAAYVDAFMAAATWDAADARLARHSTDPLGIR